MNDDTLPPTINDVRAALFATLKEVRAGTIDLDRARQVNALAQTLCDTARVEVEFIRATDGTESRFIAPKEPEALPDGITAIKQHRLGR